ncbi:hypothetical protein LTR91_003577 [Friedmanniomyces endolithicus]|uniref:Uracil catabolism protein 4 n=1 Tax=Friedmanniomyces endolithicus TaxID=329885 RepID=A0AAN6JD38_9PEZI|nr:hypothetical protein LTR35_013632 [Friedmanniomyces endolithicus]KAK0272087.1 hypothetical protein LTS00_016363 [Friedmanniomyces endolithicus]KAK0325597.1 hypothetical protein LTR82_003132 [Friedmanniomyces endolithicus]KAK0926728.1 hypothetical protein LTR57_003769 [Friedmanniomyces endolithicus]KAK0988402.1 hypothetical protein LTR54_012746 [Friedmanniomyces endolithicus]
MASSREYILSLRAVRERATIVGNAAKAGKLTHFDYHEQKMEDVADFVTTIINRDYGGGRISTIPPHGRWQHIEAGGVPRVKDLLETWRKTGCDDKELCRRVIDLFFVSVLVDAGAGDTWRYTEPHTDKVYERSEGIAIASLHMFLSNAFSTSKDTTVPRVDASGLQNLTAETLAEGFQSTEDNAMVGVPPRAALLRSLGQSLSVQQDVFGPDGRPGNVVDHILRHSHDNKADLHGFWDTLQKLLIPIWPRDRTQVDGQPVGDAWPLSTLERQADPQDTNCSIQPFHKLSQWLTYSLLVPFERILGVQWLNADSLTALAEYRNGGLFVDLGALTLKPDALERGRKASGHDLPLFDANDDVIVEWRAMTVALCDMVHEKVLKRIPDEHLTIAQVLEAGTWKSGRELAAQKRPETKSSPILIKSDGTLF